MLKSLKTRAIMFSMNHKAGCKSGFINIGHFSKIIVKYEYYHILIQYRNLRTIYKLYWKPIANLYKSRNIHKFE